jgi:hypothetical protein
MSPFPGLFGVRCARGRLASVAARLLPLVPASLLVGCRACPRGGARSGRGRTGGEGQAPSAGRRQPLRNFGRVLRPGPNAPGQVRAFRVRGRRGPAGSQARRGRRYARPEGHQAQEDGPKGSTKAAACAGDPGLDVPALLLAQAAQLPEDPQEFLFGRRVVLPARRQACARQLVGGKKGGCHPWQGQRAHGRSPGAAAGRPGSARGHVRAAFAGLRLKAGGEGPGKGHVVPGWGGRPRHTGKAVGLGLARR